MKTRNLGKTDLKIPEVALGCMRITELEQNDVAAYLERCLELGINFFDHADIYGAGECEKRFAEGFAALKIPRGSIVLQSKCGIIPGVMYDLSERHIIKSVDGILKRLKTEYLDVLILHRPDALVEPEEVASAFDKLEGSGKVRHFGVSNHNPRQIELLKRCVKQPISVNQMQLSITCSSMISRGLEVNMSTNGAVDRDGGVLDYCRLYEMTVQCWSPFQGGGGTFIGNERFADLNRVLTDLAGKYGVTETTIAAAWILRHPAKMQLITGTMNARRIEEIARAAEITLSREDWYRLYLAAGHILP